MARLCILTPDSAAGYEGRWQDTLADYVRPLEAEGLTVLHAAWTDAPPAADAYAPLLCWGYHLQWQRWRTVLGTFEGRLLNPVETLRWNGDKAYLAELEGLGAPVPPTISVEAVTPEVVASAFERLGAEVLVVKPRVSGGAFQTIRVRRGDPIEGGPTGPALIQPYLRAVASEGEWSLFWFGGRLSHSLTKVAKAGDFRVQPQFGGAVQSRPAPAAALRAAEAVLAACPHPLTYARIDLVADGEGGYSLMELEAIEPDLYLEYAADGGAIFAAAMAAAVRG